ncbi:MAG: hypothetical protein AUG49_25045 [Catenulispora sp. 13_1_20CM_3_70_7]|nr:MAG: hypothetical protein AUG49_25045 [Catenulispora sp. 13_1_20CM_3_70_7]
MESIGQSVSAFEVWAPGWVKTSAANFSQIKGLGGALTALGLFGDISTLFSPEDGGVLGTVDRLDAGANAALLAWGFVAVEPIPVVGQVALVATGLYLAGDYVANHWDTIKRWAGNVGHWASSAASKVGDVMGGVVLTVGGGIGNAWDWVWS